MPLLSSPPPYFGASEFRFYEELNDFLPPNLRKRAFVYTFKGTPSVKDAIEALNVPHIEVDLILVDGDSVDFTRRLSGGERVAVYPMFERLDVTPLIRLRETPLRSPRFVADVHLGKLARNLRLLGFDTLYRNDYTDQAIIEIALAQSRIVLTRDRGLLKHGAVTRGHWVRHTEPWRQLHEIVRAIDLAASVRPFTRCVACNGALQDACKADVMNRLPQRVRQDFDAFKECHDCRRIYWPGSHFARLRERVERFRAEVRW